MVNKEFVKIIADTGQIIYVPIATLESFGISKPDGATITIEDGVLRVNETIIGDIETLLDDVSTLKTGKVNRREEEGLYAYTHDGDEDGHIPISPIPGEAGLVRYAPSGHITTYPNPIFTFHAVNSGYLSTRLADKLDKTSATDAPDANSIVARNATGASQIVTLPDGTGAQPDDITNREYVNKKLKGLLSNVTYDDKTHEIVFDRVNEAQVVIDLPIESLIKNIELDGDDLVITFEDDSEPKRIPLGTLLVGVVRSVNGETPNPTTGNVVLNRVDSVEVEVDW